MKMRIYELAKALGVESAEVLEKCEELGIEVKSASSSVEGDDIVRLRTAFGGSRTVGKAQESRREVKGRSVIRRRARKLESPEEAPASEESAEAPAAEAEAPSTEPAATAPTEAEEAPAAAAATAAEPEPPAAEAPEAAEAPPAAEAAEAEEPTEAEAEAPATEAPAAAASAAEAVAEAEESPAPAEGEAEAADGKGPTPGRAAVLGRVDLEAVRQRHQALSEQAQRQRGPAAPAPAGGPRWPGGGGGPEPVSERPGGAPAGRRKVDFRKQRRERRSELQRDNLLRYTPRKKKGPRKGGRATEITQPKASKMVIRMGDQITVAELAKRLSVKAAELMRSLMQMGQMVTVNEALDADTATLVANEFGYEVERVSLSVDDLIGQVEVKDEDLEPRPPVVTVMGHVDHGKTSILDAIRETDVVRGEAGGITQHIGAYQVTTSGGEKVTFLDTPGHEAFTSMRARGANVTDIVILVVAADDGMMPQTKEAMNHAKAAEVPIIVAINKMDLPDANPDRIMQQLAAEGLQPEEWGGDTVFVKVSAKSGEGLDELVEAVNLQAELLELAANVKAPGRGVVVEAKLTRGRGPVATVLVQEGILSPGDMFITGHQSGKIRALMNDRGTLVKEAGPSVPVEVLGLDVVPQAGDTFYIVRDASKLRHVVDELERKQREASAAGSSKMSLEQMFMKAEAGEVKELRVVLKADTQGSVEAVTESLEKQSTAKVEVKVLHGAVGAISESDVMLASASNAIIVGFHVRPEAKARALAEREHIDVRCYSIIYELVDEVRKAMTGLLEPEYKETVLGHAEIRALFQIPRVGKIAGCFVQQGEIKRSARARLLRDNVVVHDGRFASLKHFKEDVREISQGNECGLSLEGFNDLKEGDVVEAYELEEVSPSLG